jgi:hypothetical protein
MRGQFTRRGLLSFAAAVGTSSAVGGAGSAAADRARRSDPDSEWDDREFRNYAKTREAPAEQATDPEFAALWRRRSQQNAASYAERVAAEGGWRSHANPAATWGQRATGDPALYPDVDSRDFYGTSGERHRAAFYTRRGARLSGHLWTPADAAPGDDLPGVVITNGALGAPEPLYWWAAQALAEAGYVVLTYDLRGQGRSDGATPDGTPGSPDPDVFVSNQVDAIDFFRSTPGAPYRPNVEYGRVDGAPVEPFNPASDLLAPGVGDAGGGDSGDDDRGRLGIAGHSAGAVGASVVQGLDEWPGVLNGNPVDALVAWDNLGDAADVDDRENGGANVGANATAFAETAPSGDVEPRVPAMGQSGDYFLTPTPHERPPDPDGRAAGFERWRDAGVPASQVVVRGGTHYEWSRVPTFPATSWDFGNALAEHYTVAWFDRWLKRPGEDGAGDADDRLLADGEWADRFSFHYRSKRAFPGRNQQYHECDDVRTECDVPTPPGQEL